MELPSISPFLVHLFIFWFYLDSLFGIHLGVFVGILLGVFALSLRYALGVN